MTRSIVKTLAVAALTAAALGGGVGAAQHVQAARPHLATMICPGTCRVSGPTLILSASHGLVTITGQHYPPGEAVWIDIYLPQPDGTYVTWPNKTIGVYADLYGNISTSWMAGCLVQQVKVETEQNYWQPLATAYVVPGCID